MSLFFKKDGTSRHPIDIAVSIAMLPVTFIALIPLIVTNRGRISEDDLESFAELGPNLLIFGIYTSFALLLVFTLIAVTVVVFS
jgi:hypothetical protein